MTSLNESVRAAVRRGDLHWLSRQPELGDSTPALVKLLVRHDDPRMRHLGLSRISARIADARTGEPELTDLAALLPQTLDGPPETALLLADLYQRLWQFVPARRRPQWRAADLPARVRIAWLRAEILHEPQTLHHEPAGELLYQAVEGVVAGDAPHPEALVGELAASGDPVLRRAALRLAREALHGGLLAPARARMRIGRLLDNPSSDIAEAVLRELAEPWAALAPMPRERLLPFLTNGSPAAEPAVIDAAIAASTRHGHGDLLWDVIADDAMPPRSRQRALEALGELATPEEIKDVTAAAAADPLLFGRPTVRCLRAMHRRGLFPAADDAAAIVDLALADHTISVDEVATILFTCRRDAFRALMTEDADDATWSRRLPLLVSLAQQGGDDLPVGDAVAGLLSASARPEPFLIAIRALRHTPAEEAVIDALSRAPAAALRALEVIGGQRTVSALADRLGLTAPDGDASTVGAIASYLHPVRHRALELLWHLTDDPDRRRMILGHLNPHDLPGRIAIDLGAADQRELALLAADFDPDKPVDALVRLAANGDGGTVVIIADLLSRIVADLAASGQPGVRTRLANDGRSAGRPAGEPVVPEEVVRAVHGLGHRLHTRGKLRPVCLAQAADPDEAAHALVATIALDLIERPGLSSSEQAILLALLPRAPYAGTRARVHRLLRHHDRHVRKHAIALLTADVTGADAQALSASLIALTSARDVQTVRQALLALGHVQARWAAPAIAACLDHPTMNVKKTAAAVLVHAGAPAAVPKLLFWLGHHDNPGLRATIIEALQAILGNAYGATVLAAAELAGEEQTRELLLQGLGPALSARAVNALARQKSPVARTLLTLIVSGQVRLGRGTVEDLAAQLSSYGIAVPTVRASAADGQSDNDVSALVVDGWNTETALRIVAGHERQPERLTEGQLARLRPMLADWLQLAGGRPADRRAILRLALRCCPAPWSGDEISIFTSATQVLLTDLSEAAGNDRDDLLALLEAIAPTMRAAEALDVVVQLRAFAPSAAGVRSPLALLRRCGAVLTRADVEQALAAARLGPDPWLAETEVLREGFLAAVTPVSEHGRAWRLTLEAAARTPEALHGLRARGDLPLPSRDRLNALIETFPAAGRDAHPILLDWMEDLQPIDAPSWTLAEEAGRLSAPPRVPQNSDLDQPRSAAQRDRLLTMLQAADTSRRHTAAAALRDWPEPATRQAVLSAFLLGRVEVALDNDLARTLTTMDEADLRIGGGDADSVQDRAARVAFHLDAADLLPLIPMLLDWWERGGPATRASVRRALRRHPAAADAIAESLHGRMEAAAWGFLELIADLPLLRTPALTRTCERLRADGRGDLADRLTLVDGPLRDLAASDLEATALATLRERPPPSAILEAAEGSARHELLRLIRTGQPEQIRRALSRLAEAREDTGPVDSGPVADPELEALLAGLIRHPEPRLRLQAHRVGRKLLDRPSYLRQASVLLDDPEPAVVRSAINALGHAGYQPAIPAIVALLAHSHPGIRRTAAQSLLRLGQLAIPALRYAASHARPDRRQRYVAVLDQITVA